METIEQPEERFPLESIPLQEKRNLPLESIAFAIAALTAISCIAALFLINLEYLLPELARSNGLTLSYAHKLWLAPTSIVYLLASIAWTISHLAHNDN
ncbi:hypothetical protein RE428_11950 [Marinobacter nanhaiticus D15-8W]|uniref:Uncharacterized protein n=1 Tax=Marinobacter nanhaiticus D15-8W TaxID=626887 RepID=N6WVG3_9GAMM|nr:hypothetical protein [Marinobacter nanhaiticus]ENO12828.1 hypothetical protein J057_15560 [Marinobacter nanhaiticus D15-8W]BES70177.1 hypothetical protein RE428_11950 [Marinobacter nanhaiticus D15-8W]